LPACPPPPNQQACTHWLPPSLLFLRHVPHTEEERARRLAEMSSNAEQHDMARTERLRRAAEADAARDGTVANAGAHVSSRPFQHRRVPVCTWARAHVCMLMHVGTRTHTQYMHKHASMLLRIPMHSRIKGMHACMQPPSAYSAVLLRLFCWFRYAHVWYSASSNWCTCTHALRVVCSF